MNRLKDFDSAIMGFHWKHGLFFARGRVSTNDTEDSIIIRKFEDSTPEAELVLEEYISLQEWQSIVEFVR